MDVLLTFFHVIRLRQIWLWLFTLNQIKLAILINGAQTLCLDPSKCFPSYPAILNSKPQTLDLQFQTKSRASSSTTNMFSVQLFNPIQKRYLTVISNSKYITCIHIYQLLSHELELKIWAYNFEFQSSFLNKWKCLAATCQQKMIMPKTDNKLKVWPKWEISFFLKRKYGGPTQDVKEISLEGWTYNLVILTRIMAQYVWLNFIFILFYLAKATRFSDM